MYHPTTRVLTVLELLQARGQIGGPELAARLEVDRRTVRRYVTMLQDLGVPVEATPGRGGGYRLRPGFKLPPLMFSDDEALALTLGLLAARRLGLAVAAPAVEGALAKIERVLPAALRDRVAAVQATLATDLLPSAVAPAPAGVTVATLAAAARDERRVRLRYAARDGAETARALDPYGVVYLTGRWFTVGHCHLRDAVRVFRLDRIRAIEATSEPFARPAGFDALVEVRRSLATVPNRWRVQVTLDAPLDHVRAFVPEEMVILDPTPGGVLLRCSANDLDWIAWTLLGLRCPVAIHEPPELREAMARLGEQAASLADRPLVRLAG